MACNRSCCGCPREVYISEVAFTAGALVLTLPEDESYDRGEKFCFLITTALPDGITRDAPVVAVVGDGTTQFPLLTVCGAQVVEQQIVPRKHYPFRVATSAAGGSLIILRPLPCVNAPTLAALNDAAAAGGGA